MSITQIIYAVLIFKLKLFLPIITKILKSQLGEYTKQNHREVKGNLNLPKETISDPTLWFHAASVGESYTLEKIIPLIRESYPQYKILITNTSACGQKLSKDVIGPDYSFILPFENKLAYKKIISTLNVKKLFIVETELWPYFIKTTSKLIPVYLVNGRISKKSFKYYYRFRKFFGAILENITCVYSQPEYISRFKAINKNVKFEKVISLKYYNMLNKLDGKIPNKPIDGDFRYFLAASLHQGETKIILEAFKLMRSEYDKLIIIPRQIHSQEVNKIIKDIKSYNFTYSKYAEKNMSTDVIVVNKIGLNHSFYAYASKIFVGGSLINIGGHNILEPIAFKKSCLTGYHMQNFRDILKYTLNFELTHLVKNAEDIANAPDSFVPEKQIELFTQNISKVTALTLNKYLEVIDS